MRANIKITEGDTAPPYRTTLTENGESKDLSNASNVQFEMVHTNADVTVSGSADIVSASDGTVAYHWVDGDTSEPGLYLVEWTVEYDDGSEQGFPNDSPDLLFIRPDA